METYTPATIRTVEDKSVVIWQGYSEDMVAEPALLFTEYGGMVELSQEGRNIIINNESLKQIEKLFRLIRIKNNL